MLQYLERQQQLTRSDAPPGDPAGSEVKRRPAADLPVSDNHVTPALSSIAAADYSTIAPGQVWRITVPTGETRLSPRECRAIAAADAVIYDDPLAAVVAAHRPPGSYAEPARSKRPYHSVGRCIQLARDGWRVVLLVEQRRPAQVRREPPTILFSAEDTGFSAPHCAVMANGLAG